jgi:hypothetical protein
MPKFIVAYCTYNRAQPLPALANALFQQTCPLPFKILAVNNNSQGNTHALGMIRSTRQRWLENRKK